jgi:hypothetical protein
LKSLIRLYPRAWRERYGDEFAALVGSQRVRPRLVLDIVAGAIDAWLSPQPHVASARAVADEGGNVMKLLTMHCADARNLSRGEQWRAALPMIGVTVGISLVYVGVNRLWGHNVFIEALGIAVFPVAVFVAMMPGYLRGHSLAARVLVTAVLCVLVYLGALLAAWI